MIFYPMQILFEKFYLFGEIALDKAFCLKGTVV
jgi:hypothetical protein